MTWESGQAGRAKEKHHRQYNPDEERQDKNNHAPDDVRAKEPPQTKQQQTMQT